MSYPVCLEDWLDAVGDADDTVSHEAVLGLRFLIEKHVCTGPENWLADVNAFLVLQPVLTDHGLVELRDVTLDETEVDALAAEVWRRLLAGAAPGWRYAYILKQAIGLPVIADEVAGYLDRRWREDEAVAFLETAPGLSEQRIQRILRSAVEQSPLVFGVQNMMSNILLIM